jgi:hypothetical protein
MDLTMSAILPNGNDGLLAGVGVLHYHVIRGSKHALDAVVFGCSAFLAPRLLKLLYKAAFDQARIVLG